VGRHGAPSHIRPSDLEVLRTLMEPEERVECVAARDGSLEYSVAVEPHGVTLLEVSCERQRPALAPQFAPRPTRSGSAEAVACGQSCQTVFMFVNSRMPVGRAPARSPSA